MHARQLLGRVLQPPSVREGGRLNDFRFAGSLVPALAFVGVGIVIYVWGTRSSLTILIKLWVAYSVAFVFLACLAQLRGSDAAWRYVLPTAILGIMLGGLASALVALAPSWSALLNPPELAREWLVGVAFSAFFVGLSLATSEVRRREQIVAEAKRQLLEARLQTLTAQIEPHFLMNTLANLRYLINKDGRLAAQMLEHLADFLQGALERSRSPQSTLGQEIQLVESYLSIMQIRLGERLHFATAIPDGLKDVPFPPLLLQTLVENAVTHGIEPHEGNGMIDVTVQHDGLRIVLSVTDNGVGITHEHVGAHGLGLRNTQQRLESFYAGRASLELAGASPSGTVARIFIPAAEAT